MTVWHCRTTPSLFVASLIFIVINLSVCVWAMPEGKPPLPEPLGYVSDHAGVFDEDWKARVRSVAQDLERKTGVEMVVVTVKNLGPYRSGNEYAAALYQRWGIGSAQQDYGVLILAVVDDRQAAVVVGRSLYPILTSPIIERVARENLEPTFRLGHFGPGLYRATVSLASTMQDIRVGVGPRPHRKGVGFWITAITCVALIWTLWWISRPDLRHPFGKIRRGEFWSTGQGGFGGNFGGAGRNLNGEGWR